MKTKRILLFNVYHTLMTHKKDMIIENVAFLQLSSYVILELLSMQIAKLLYCHFQVFPCISYGVDVGK